MFKLLFYTALIGGSTYVAANILPNTYKETILNKTGLGKIQGESFALFNPAGERAKLISDLRENISAMESYSKGDEAIAPAIEQSKDLLAELEKLNPKTGVVTGVIGKILGVTPPKETVSAASIAELTAEQKAQICQ
ncbi:MAG: hypothetical protein Q8Q90_03400 [bacterium]|nr:hypothetical protein [bacterium]